MNLPAQSQGIAPYDTIASLYDRHWGHAFAKVAVEAFRTHLANLLPRDATVLDLCCGTGLMVADLELQGYRTFGVDESSRMLDIARRNAPYAQFQQADMARFRWGLKFDAAVWLYNSLNHAHSLDHLRATLANVREHLTHEGFLLFDYVAPESFETDWECCEEIDAEEGVRTIRYVHERAAGYATCWIDGESIRQTLFEPAEIGAVLRSVGLVVQRETPMVGENPPRGRHLVLARKASAGERP